MGEEKLWENKTNAPIKKKFLLNTGEKKTLRCFSWDEDSRRKNPDDDHNGAAADGGDGAGSWLKFFSAIAVPRWITEDSRSSVLTFTPFPPGVKLLALSRVCNGRREVHREVSKGAGFVAGSGGPAVQGRSLPTVPKCINLCLAAVKAANYAY